MWIIKYLKLYGLTYMYVCYLLQQTKDKSLPYLFFWSDLFAPSDIYTRVTGPIGEEMEQCLPSADSVKPALMFPPAVISQSYLRPYNCLVGTDWTDGFYKCSLDQRMSPDWAGFGVTVICWIITHCCGSIGFIVFGEVWLFPFRTFDSLNIISPVNWVLVSTQGLWLLTLSNDCKQE